MEFNQVPQCGPCLEAINRDHCRVNHDAVKIWRLTEYQVITAGMGGVVGLNQLAVWAAIDHYPVREPRRVFERVLRLHQEITMEEFADDSPKN